jgi:lambda family phage portal protein
MLQWLTNLFARPQKAVFLRARYDAAQTTDENKRHWTLADGLSARCANNPEVRRKLRERARYEAANNSYAHGILLSLANDLVGIGPKLQVLLPDATSDYNRRIEKAFTDWSQEIQLAEKLRVMAMAKLIDGEAFALFTNNPNHYNSVQLDLRLVEADQIATTQYDVQDPSYQDGIFFDQHGNPTTYHVLPVHPGDSHLHPLDSTPVAARSVIHWFRLLRPGQVRGVPEITPALPLFAQLRRYTLATLSAAEIAASFAAMLESDAPADGASEEPNPFETLEIERGMLTVTPAGSRMNQLKAEQPTTTYSEFKRELLKEIGRCLCAPHYLIAGDASQYNYSSARMDALTYRSHVKVERSHCVSTVLDRVFAAWLSEAGRIPGLLPEPLPFSIPHAWYWPGWESLDVLKEAQGDTERLANGTTTLTELLAGEGKDLEEVLRQRAKEKQLEKELGLEGGKSQAIPPAPVVEVATNG